MKVPLALIAALLLLNAVLSVVSQDCPCASEIGKACRQPWDGPDFDNDKNWEYAGLVDFMDEKELAQLPFEEELEQPRELPPYDPEKERPVAISPEGKKYIWRGPLPSSRDEQEPIWPHVGGDVPVIPGSPYMPTEGGSCLPFNELREGRTTVAGNDITLYQFDNFVVISAPYTNANGAIQPFPPGGVDVIPSGNMVMRIHAAAYIRVIDPTIRAIVITGLSAIDDMVVNMKMMSSNGVTSQLYIGSFPANLDASSGFEVRLLDAASKTYAFISHNGPISYLLLGHMQINGSLCGYDSVPEQWYDSPLADAKTLRGRSILGVDTRKRDNPTTGYPLRVFGAIHSPTGDLHYCSGSKIGPRHFLTAGHCMFSKKSLKWIPNARIWFGQNGDGAGLPPPASQAPYGITKHSWYYTTVGWVDDQDWRFDYGMIVLKDKPETAGLGWLGFSSKGYRSEPGKTVIMHGHPGSGYTCSASPRADKKCGGYMYGDSGAVKERSDHHLYYTIDTNKGNSGSGVYVYNGGNRMVVGVHAYGEHNGDGRNKAVRIRNEVFDNLINWRQQWPSQHA